MSFFESTFNGEAIFNGSFKGETNFGHVSFQDKAHFSAEFIGPANFVSTIFNGETFFGRTAFMEKMNFESTAFKSMTHFGNNRFNGGKGFEGATFENMSISIRYDPYDPRYNIPEKDVLKDLFSILGNASIRNLDLSGYDLSGMDFRNLVLINANFHHSIFQPQEVGVNILLGARGLSTIKFDRFEKIAELRKKAREAGFKYQARQLTAALRKKRFSSALFSEQFIENFFINYPTNYGGNPWRSLVIFGVFVIIFSCPYMIALETRGRDGIWKVWVNERARTDLGEKKPQLIKLRGLPVVVYALYFSLLSAFHIGWRDLNVGSWITRMQPHEYTLKATGWVRFVSGVQSLISIYLLVMWFLSYFGQLIE